jgi:hypothetical protein
MNLLNLLCQGRQDNQLLCRLIGQLCSSRVLVINVLSARASIAVVMGKQLGPDAATTRTE